MRRIAMLLLVAGLAATWIGCQAGSQDDVTAVPATGNSGSSEYTLVTLKVPNMT